MTEEDIIKTQLYNEFYDNNKESFERNKQEFMRQQRIYVEAKFTEIKYNLKKEGE